MHPARIVAIVAIVLTGVLAGALILRQGGGAGRADLAGEEDSPEEGAATGPHGGRLLTDGAFQAEVTIFERGVPPQLRLYFFEDGEPIDPAEVEAELRLRRLGGETQAARFRPEDGYLVGDRAVAEPHSFDVELVATRNGDRHEWSFASYEGRVELSPEAISRAGIDVETAAPATLETRLRLNGLIVPDEDRLAHVLPRFPGIVKEVRKRIGDRVERGETMAVVQSNQSLRPYDVVSEVAGTVIQKHVTPGEFVAADDELFVVADLGTVWVDLNVYRQDFPRLSVGQPVVLDAGEGLPKAEGRISYISPFGAPNTQTMLARVVLPNPEGAWRPGLFVTGEVIVEEVTVPLAVRRNALQALRDWTVVFVQVGTVFEARPIEVGRRDDDRVEVLSGLSPGERYVAEGSFVLKADVGKSGASHEH